MSFVKVLRYNGRIDAEIACLFKLSRLCSGELHRLLLMRCFSKEKSRITTIDRERLLNGK